MQRVEQEVLRNSRERGYLQAALYAAPLVGLAGAAWAHRNMIDDGFIYLRTVHQVTGGHGPVFNIGERVESFTGPLRLAVLSVADLLTPFRLEWLAVVLGIASTLGGVALAMLGSARLVRQGNSDAILIPFGAVVLAALVPMWYFASSGLETGLTFLWLGGSVWILGRWSASGNSLEDWGAVVLGLGWLVRPELVLYSIAFLFVVFAFQWKTDSRQRLARLAVLAVALPVAYQLFRMGYYGALVANTAVAKEGTRLRWQRGWRYFLNFVRPYWFVVPFVIILVGGYAPLARQLGRRQARAKYVMSAFLLAGLVNAFYVVAVGGDYEHARLLLPAVFAVCAPIAVIPATRRYVAGLALAPWTIAAVFVLHAPAHRVGQDFVLPTPGRVTTSDFGWGPSTNATRQLTGPTLHIQESVVRITEVTAPLLPAVHPPAAALLAIGATSYAGGNSLYVLDMLGLADPLTARLKTPLYTTLLPLPGHEKLLPRPWIIARLFAPDAQVSQSALPSGSVFALIPSTTGVAFDNEVLWARAALQCPALRQLNRDTTAHLSFTRFLGNIVDAFANTRLRVPPDPETAYHKLCGPRTSVPLAAISARTSRETRSAVFIPLTRVIERRRQAAVSERPAQPRSQVKALRLTAVSGFV
jgi:arabinofuranosyltransferase